MLHYIILCAFLKFIKFAGPLLQLTNLKFITVSSVIEKIVEGPNIFLQLFQPKSSCTLFNTASSAAPLELTVSEDAGIEQGCCHLTLTAYSSNHSSRSNPQGPNS